MPSHSFPENFLFGAATASHQIEGGQHNDWSEWEKRNAKRLAAESEAAFAHWNPHWAEFRAEATDPQNYISGTACDHWNRYAEDFSILSELHLNAYRFSIEWSRLEPEEGAWNEEAAAHYRAMLADLRNRGITPFVTLWHWTLPLWLAEGGGVLHPRFPEYFERFAGRALDILGPDVRFVVTLNEPDVLSAHAYLKGAWPPERKSLLSFFRAQSRLACAHRLAYRLLKQARPDLQIGVAKHQVYFEAAGNRPWNRLLKALADYFWNGWFLRRIRGCQDFIGLNHYNRNLIDGWYGKNPNAVQTDFGWEYLPESLEYALLELRRYGLPVYVTENGLADAHDRLRPDFIPRALGAVVRAREAGADVRGYFYWSLLDNFEWDKGFWLRFGLVEVDFASQKRSIRHSARIYAEIARNKAIFRPE